MAQLRLNAIHLLLCGASFELTMQHSNVSERCLKNWIYRFNKSGIDGITYRPKSGRPRLMNAEEIQEKILPVIIDPQRANRQHWTAVSLCGWLKDREKLKISYRTFVRYLNEHDFVRRFPRPMPEPPNRDAWTEQRKAFVPLLRGLMEQENVEVFFGDESGFEGDPRPRQRWVKRGSNPTQGYYGGHVRQNIVGAVSPKTGQFTSLVVSHCDTEIFQAFLDTMAEETLEQKEKNMRVILVLDNASWHKSKKLNWHHIEPMYLPAYSPDLNPIERIWQYLKSHGMAGYLSKRGDELCDKLCEEVKKLLEDPETIKSISKVSVS